MKNKRYDFLNELSDSENIEETAVNYPVLDKTEKQHIAQLCEEKLAMNRHENDIKDELYRVDEVSGDAEVITKTPWYRSPALSIAAAVVIAAGVGTAALVNNFGGNTPGALMDSEELTENDFEEPAEETAENPTMPEIESIDDIDFQPLDFEIDLTGNAADDLLLKLYSVSEGDEENIMTTHIKDGAQKYSGSFGNCGNNFQAKIEIVNEENGLSAVVGNYFFDYTEGVFRVISEDPWAALSAVDALWEVSPGAADTEDGLYHRVEQFEIDLPEKAEGRFIISFMVVKDNKADTFETPVFYCPETSHISQEVEIHGERLAVTLHNLQNDKKYSICAFDLLKDEPVLDKDLIYNAFLEVDGIKETE